MSNASRQRSFKQRAKARNLVRLEIWIPRHRAASLAQVARLICRRPRYTIDRVVDEVTGRVVGLS